MNLDAINHYVIALHVSEAAAFTASCLNIKGTLIDLNMDLKSHVRGC